VPVNVQTSVCAFSVSSCRDCPSGQVASTDAVNYPVSASYFVINADGSRGFVSVLACVNLPGKQWQHMAPELVHLYLTCF